MIGTARQQWLDVMARFPAGWYSAHELARVTGISRSKVIQGIIYARCHGMVEERIDRMVCPDRLKDGFQTYLRSSYRLKTGAQP